VQAISSSLLPSSQLFRAFVWATLDHTAAQKRCSSDFGQGESMNRLLIVAILIISTVPLCAKGQHRKVVAIEPLPMCGSFHKPCVFKLLSKPYCWGCNTALDQARFVAWIKANP
jgi:hypothetical protein